MYKQMLMVVSVILGSFSTLTFAATPNQPNVISVPSPARLYPYTYSNSPDDVNGPYVVTIDYTDNDGASNLRHVYLQITGNGPAQTLMYYNLTTIQQWDGEGYHLYNISASKSLISNGYRVTWQFQLKSSWTPSTNVDFDAWSLDYSDLSSLHRSYDWNGIYDNNLGIADARKVNLVDNDGDGWYSSVRVEADANTSVSSRTVQMYLFQRNSSTGGSGAMIWGTGTYTTYGSNIDWKGIEVTVASRGTYDFAWELYDPTWFITNRWYDADGDISNIQMEPESEDVILRGMYVDYVYAVLGNRSSQLSLLEFAKNNNIKYLAMYVSADHAYLLPPGDHVLDEFIQLAKTKYNIQKLGLIGSSTADFDRYVSYNASHTGKIDVLNLEKEFWNSGDFDTWIGLLQYMESVGTSQGLEVEAYVGGPSDITGMPTAEQMHQLCGLVDRLFVHAYVSDPIDAFSFTRDRLLWAGEGGDQVAIWPIYSSESSFFYYDRPFMGDWELISKGVEIGKKVA